MATNTTSDTNEPEHHETRHERQLHAHETGDPPRRTMPVGRVWLVGAVCLLVGALLNAPGIRKTALGQDVGWRRDVARLFADPLYDVSHALLLDRLRVGLQDVIERSGQDDIDLTLPSPTIPGTNATTTTTVPGAPPSTTTTTAPKKQKFSPAKQLRLWVGGDSLAITPGESVINAALATQAVGLTDALSGHVATGLARPEVFNWPAFLADVIATKQPDAMVLTIGSNDDQDLTGEGGVGPFGSEAWQAEYRRRVGGLMDEVTGTGKVQLFWVGIPLMRNVPRFNDHYRLINDIARTEAEKRPGKVVYVDTVPVLAGVDGGYADFQFNPDGTVVQIRAGDGIHFTRAGGDRIANVVLAAMQQLYDLTSWQNESTTTTTVPSTTSTTKAKKG